MKAIIRKVIDFAKNGLNGDTSGHDWYHTKRVYSAALLIAQGEGAVDTDVIEIAALLHDVMDHKLGYGDEDRARMVKDCLRGSEISQEQIDHVIYIINNISFKGGKNKHVLTTIEGKIVQDADRLDALGAIGIARTFAFGGHAGRAIYSPEHTPDAPGEDSISHFHEKLLKLKALMHTETGTRLAEKRHLFMLEFLEEFYSEWGERV